MQRTTLDLFKEFTAADTYLAHRAIIHVLHRQSDGGIAFGQREEGLVAQTIAESLNTKCKGQAWIIVTAQQDMNSVIGDMTARQENDFSRIQARFATRVPLNSADVAEVIQRRLLAKTEEGVATLKNLYAREENNLKTLFDFADGSIRLKNYSGLDNFVES